jgi:outer membrane protein TolC
MGMAHAEAIRVGMAVDGPWARNEEIRTLFREEITRLVEGEYDVQFPAELTLTGDWTSETAERNLRRLLSEPSCDLVLAMGVISSYLACQVEPLPKPVIAPFIIDPVAQGIPMRDGTSGRKTLAYLLSPFNVERDLRVFYDIHPFQKLVLFYSSPFMRSIPNLRARLQAATQPLGVEVVYQTVEYQQPGSVTRALQSIPDDADAVYLTAMLHLSPSEMDSLVSGINARRLPSFSLFGRVDVQRGVLFGLSSAVFAKFARRVALQFRRIVGGEDPGSLSVAFSGEERLTVNMQTARQIGMLPSWDVLTEAELLYEERKEVAATWSLRSAIEEALQVNLTLRQATQEVAVGERDVDRARSPLLPQGGIGATGAVIDQDQAEASFGLRPERSIVGSASASQLIYSENAWIPYRVQSHVQRARESGLESTRLDVGLEAAAALLNVLRANTAERISKDNVKLSRENLERARVRNHVGMAGPEEVYRWESNLASGRTRVIDANAERNVAEIELNRVLRRPLEERFATREVGLEDPDLTTDAEALRGYVDDPMSFRTFRNFMVEEALRQSPELEALEAQIAAQRSIRSGTERSFFIPEIAAFGEVSNRLWSGGAGTEPPNLGGGTEIDDTNWSLGIQATLPLFNGGGRLAERGRAIEEIRRLELQRDEVAQRVEQRMRNALHRMGASSANMKHTRISAEAARRNLDVVSDQYSRGVVPIITLLDAQNSTFLAEQRAADAIYDFFLDLMDVERAIGRLYILAPEADKEELRQRVEAYFREQGTNE